MRERELLEKQLGENFTRTRYVLSLAKKASKVGFLVGVPLISVAGGVAMGAILLERKRGLAKRRQQVEEIARLNSLLPPEDSFKGTV